MPRYVKRDPEVIEAIKYDGTNFAVVKDWFIANTPDGSKVLSVEPGQYIRKDGNTFAIVSGEAFDATMMPAPAAAATSEVIG